MYDLRLQFAAEVCVFGRGGQRACRLLMQRSPRTSSMSACLGGSAKLLKLLSDHNVSDGIMQKRMDNEPEWIGVMQEFRVANLNRGCTFPQQCKPTNRNMGSSRSCSGARWLRRTPYSRPMPSICGEISPEMRTFSIQSEAGNDPLRNGVY